MAAKPVYARVKYCCICTYSCVLAPMVFPMAGESSYIIQPSDLVHPHKTGRLANLLDMLEYDYAKYPLKFC